jgi:hypothetical protein
LKKLFGEKQENINEKKSENIEIKNNSLKDL